MLLLHLAAWAASRGVLLRQWTACVSGVARLRTGLGCAAQQRVPAGIQDKERHRVLWRQRVRTRCAADAATQRLTPNGADRVSVLALQTGCVGLVRSMVKPGCHDGLCLDNSCQI